MAAVLGWMHRSVVFAWFSNLKSSDFNSEIQMQCEEISQHLATLSLLVPDTVI